MSADPRFRVVVPPLTVRFVDRPVTLLAVAEESRANVFGYPGQGLIDDSERFGMRVVSLDSLKVWTE